MASLNMNGPYVLSIEEVNSKINRNTYGNYALGYIDVDKFIVQYVGRSDTNLNMRVSQHVGEYEKFKYSYASSPRDAFEKECKNFHDFGETRLLNNKIHPDRPANAGWKCPYCKIFG